MGKIAFVPPWYGENIPGGAEMETRATAKHLIQAGMDVEILTTCARSFSSNWSRNYHRPGFSVEGGVPVRRFRVKKRNEKKFNRINYKLMHNISVSPEEEKQFVDEMINSPQLYDYIEKNKNSYDAFLYIPYMFGTTYHGCMCCPEKAVLLPCFHEEAYIHLKIFKEIFENISGMIFNSTPEQELANRIFDLTRVSQIVMGIGMETKISCDPYRFRRKYHLNDGVPFLLYAGRKDKGKNVDLLLKYFEIFKKLHPDDALKLLLIGGGSMNIPDEIRDSVCDLGFIEQQDKYDAYSAALALCQPSVHESFSLVIMESWLCGRPVLVHGGCEVTKGFTNASDGGLYFSNYPEFESCIEFLEKETDLCGRMGENGRKYVASSFDWTVIVDKYKSFLDSIVS